MEKIIKKESIAPTLTLAQLYDSQNQLFNALHIYNKLLGIGDDSEINQRINGIYEKLVNKEFDNYQGFLKQIFSKEDLVKFRILTDNQHLEYVKSIQELESENEDNENEKDEEISSEVEVAPVEVKPEVVEPQVVEPKKDTETEEEVIPEKIAEKQVEEPNVISKDSGFSWEEMKLGDLMDFISLKIDKNRTLSSISLKDIKEIIDVFRK